MAYGILDPTSGIESMAIVQGVEKSRIRLSDFTSLHFWIYLFIIRISTKALQAYHSGEQWLEVTSVLTHFAYLNFTFSVCVCRNTMLQTNMKHPPMQFPFTFRYNHFYKIPLLTGFQTFVWRILYISKCREKSIVTSMSLSITQKQFQLRASPQVTPSSLYF